MGQVFDLFLFSHDFWFEYNILGMSQNASFKEQKLMNRHIFPDGSFKLIHLALLMQLQLISVISG